MSESGMQRFRKEGLALVMLPKDQQIRHRIWMSE